VERRLELPIKAGEVYGHVTVSAEGKGIGKVNLIADKSFPAPALGTKLVYYWHRLGAALGID
jgi:hypothetical protein